VLFTSWFLHGRASDFLLDVPKSCSAIEGRLDNFVLRWLRMSWQGVISRVKSLEILRHCRESNPGHGKNKRWNTFILQFSYHGWLHSWYKYDIHCSLQCFTHQNLGWKIHVIDKIDLPSTTSHQTSGANQPTTTSTTRPLPTIQSLDEMTTNKSSALSQTFSLILLTFSIFLMWFTQWDKIPSSAIPGSNFECFNNVLYWYGINLI